MIDSEGKKTTDKDYQDVLWAAIIQNFEFTYELCRKFIQRWLKANGNPAEAEFPLTLRDLFRRAAHEKLIHDPLLWFKYAEARNLTSHTYSRPTAQKVFRVAVEFLPDAKYLLERLERRND